MNTRRTGAIVIMMFAIVSFGFVTVDFSNWESTIQNSPFILVVRCTKSPEPKRLVDGVMNDNPLQVHPMGGVTLSDVEIISTLKVEPGRLPVESQSLMTNLIAGLVPGKALTLWSKCRPYQGDNYLLFATEFQDTNCFALADYQVVPLGHSFSTNVFIGLNLEQKVKVMLQYRLDNLSRELAHGLEEKDRLERLKELDTPTNTASAK